MVFFIQARLKNWVERYAGTAPVTVVESASAKDHISRISLILLWSIALFFAVMFIWITIAEVDTVTRAEGRVIPSAKTQVIQNFEGGIVAEILAKQGQSVIAGERLIVLSQVQHDSDLKARQQLVASLEARAARLSALASGDSPKFPSNIAERSPELLAVESATYLSKKLEQESQLRVLDLQIEQKRHELGEAQVTLSTTEKILEYGRQERDTVVRLVERGLEPRLELVRIDRAMAEQEGRALTAKIALTRLRSSIDEITSRKSALLRQFRSESLNELNLTLAELNPMRQSLPALSDKVERTVIKAPMRGIVNRVFVTTVGGTVRPGDPIVEMVPGDDQLVVEAMVMPKDIGFVKIGQTARVKITAYDYSIFGAMDGKVQSISADAVPNEKGEAFFQVRIETKTKAIEALDKKLTIMPGMQAQIDIITSKKTILQFLSKPLVALKENAFRER